MAGDVRLCGACGGLQLACESAACTRSVTLNRPFARFCRRCRAELAAAEPNGWDDAGRAGWDGPLTDPGPPQEIANLSDRRGRIDVRVALGMAQGVLAAHEVHLGGGLLALLHPLARPGSNPLVWSAADPVEKNREEAPFDPRLLLDARHLVFSRPSRVVVLDLWGCFGLSAAVEVPPWSLDLGDWRLAAPPVALGDATFGLLRSHANAYRWEVWSPDDRDAPIASVDVPLVGAPCRIALVDDRVLAFATPRGHWVWSKADARAAVVSDAAPLRTWPQKDTPTDAQIHIDDHSQSLGQGFLVPQPGAAPRFRWYYRVRDERAGDGWVEQYFVEFSPLRFSLSRRLFDCGDATPIGPTWGIASVAEMLFSRGSMLIRENNNGAIDPCDVRLPRLLTSLWLADPLLAVLGMDDDNHRHLDVHSLKHRRHWTRVEMVQQIVSDPLIWSRWLFTAEFDEREGPRIRRREIATSGSAQ